MVTDISNYMHDELAETCWIEIESLHPLKVMVNPWRVPYFKGVWVKKYSQELCRVRPVAYLLRNSQNQSNETDEIN